MCQLTNCASAMHCMASLSAFLHNSTNPTARLAHECNVSCLLPVALISPSLNSPNVMSLNFAPADLPCSSDPLHQHTWMPA
jgi:hypothetical protein